MSDYKTIDVALIVTKIFEKAFGIVRKSVQKYSFEAATIWGQLMPELAL